MVARSASRSARSVYDHDRIGAVLRFRGRNLTTALDWLALVLVVATPAISLTGGFSFRLGDVRITARNPGRQLQPSR